MRLIIVFFITLLTTIGCNNTESDNSSNDANNSGALQYSWNSNANSYKQELGEFEIWQLDYFPDSIFINRTINYDYMWESNYAYNIQFCKDSCLFIGWHESWWNHLKQVDKNKYLTTGSETNYWELTFTSDGKLRMREFLIHSADSIEISKFYPYHKTDKILTQESLQKRIASEIFKGRYELLFNDTFECERTIVFDENFGVKGIKEINHYRVETEVDWDFPIDNAFWLLPKNNKSEKCFSFKFSADTLFLKDYETVLTLYGEVAEIRKNRIILKKISNTAKYRCN